MKLDSSSFTSLKPMKKFQAIIRFQMDDQFMSLVPSHRTYINYLMNKGLIDSYAVSMESLTCWITLNTTNKETADKYLAKSPLYKYWTYEIEELFVYDSQHYRLPAVQLN
jgi:hypothetical protein